MRSKAPLALMEQAVMILVFALAAALCLRAFIFSDQTSKRIDAREHAASRAQSAAEIIKSEGSKGKSVDEAFEAAAERMGGKVKDGTLRIEYGEDWNKADGDENPQAYVLEVKETGTDVPGLKKVSVKVVTANENSGEATVLFEISAAWQDMTEAE